MVVSAVFLVESEKFAALTGVSEKICDIGHTNRRIIKEGKE